VEGSLDLALFLVSCPAVNAWPLSRRQGGGGNRWDLTRYLRDRVVETIKSFGNLSFWLSHFELAQKSPFELPPTLWNLVIASLVIPHSANLD
jgi:hypothetical protein